MRSRELFLPESVKRLVIVPIYFTHCIKWGGSSNGRHCMKLEIRITLKKNCSGLNPEAESSKLLAKGAHALEVLHSQNLLEGKKSNVCRHKMSWCWFVQHIAFIYFSIQNLRELRCHVFWTSKMIFFDF